MKFNLDQNLRYGIMLSGGLDSAILLGLLILENKNINIQPFTIPKIDGAILYADPVVEFINCKFQTDIPETIKVGDPNVHHRAQSKTAVKEIFEKHQIDFLFIAINRNPEELSSLPGAPLRDTRSDNPKIIFPFVDLLKTDIIKIAVENNLNDLFDITHSCTEQQIGRCNICWQCTERAWAFSNLLLTDSGKK
jgi:tRNA(Ile)-lysidine synthase TilS/MesJ